MDGVEKTLKCNMPTILSGTVELFIIAPPPVYVMAGAGKPTLQE
jgi:hypothetical protein